MEDENPINLTDASNIADACNIASGTNSYDDSTVSNTFPEVTTTQLDMLKLLAAWIKAHGS